MVSIADDVFLTLGGLLLPDLIDHWPSDMLPSIEGGRIDRRIVHVLRAINAQPRLRARRLAAIVELGPSHLERLFKRQMGVTISEYSLELRLLRAQTLLRTTYPSIKEIRNEAGIPDPSHFVRYFKAAFGKTPTAYRQSLDARLGQQITEWAN